MQIRYSCVHPWLRAHLGPCLAILLAASGAQAQERLTLKQAFDTAWSRQPDARGGELRRDAAEARRDAAGNWLVAAPSLAMSAKSDRATGNDGARESNMRSASACLCGYPANAAVLRHWPMPSAMRSTAACWPRS